MGTKKKEVMESSPLSEKDRYKKTVADMVQKAKMEAKSRMDAAEVEREKRAIEDVEILTKRIEELEKTLKEKDD